MLWFSKSAVLRTHGGIGFDHWLARPTHASKQSQNTFDMTGATVQNVFAIRFFRCLSYQHKILGFNSVTLFSAMCEEVCLGSNPSPVAQLQKQMLWFKGGLAVVGQKLARTGRFSCFHPTSRHDCCGFRALTLLSRKRSQRLLSRNSFMDAHKKLTTKSWWSIVEK